MVVQAIQNGDWNSSKTGVPLPMLACNWVGSKLLTVCLGCSSAHASTTPSASPANTNPLVQLGLRRKSTNPATANNTMAAHMAEYWLMICMFCLWDDVLLLVYLSVAGREKSRVLFSLTDE